MLCQLSAGTTPTLTLGVNASQTPTGTTYALAEIKTTNLGAATELSAALSASGAVNVLTSPQLTPSVFRFQASVSGTLLASATAGTFAVTATGTGTGFTGTIKPGTTCHYF